MSPSCSARARRLASDSATLGPRDKIRNLFSLFSGDCLLCHVQPLGEIETQLRCRSVPMGLGFRELENRAEMPQRTALWPTGRSVTSP